MGDVSMSDSRTHALYHHTPLSLIQHSEMHSDGLAYWERTRDWNHRDQDFSQRAENAGI